LKNHNKSGLKEIESLENKLQLDPNFLSESIDDEAYLADARGNIFSKRDFIKSSENASHSSQMKVIETKIKYMGDSAVVTSAISLSMPGFSGLLRLTRIWTKLNNQWKIIVLLMGATANYQKK
jgi:hypothetical protein